MRTTSLSCLGLLALMCAACAPSEGYYDVNGNYVLYDRDKRAEFTETHYPDGTPKPGKAVVYAPAGAVVTPYSFSQRGYYDYTGVYIVDAPSVSVPPSMFPPAGMCRVWFTDRALANQPPIETCTAIRERVPAGAYVIYGG